MTRPTTVLALVVGAALLPGAPAARAQGAAKPDDARTCATVTGQPAIDACTRALASHRFNRGETALLHYRRAMLLREAGAPDRAIKDFTAAIHLNGDVIPMSADAFDIRISQRNAYLNRGRAYADMNADESALADYDTLLKADPKDVQALLARARTLDKKGACDRAVADYGAIIAIDPRVWDSYFGRARCYVTLGERDRAIADYRTVLAGAPPDLTALAAQAELKRLGDAP
jgi:tetratricopeptide (TPR) repeat protein